MNLYLWLHDLLPEKRQCLSPKVCKVRKIDLPIRPIFLLYRLIQSVYSRLQFCIGRLYQFEFSSDPPILFLVSAPICVYWSRLILYRFIERKKLVLNLLYRFFQFFPMLTAYQCRFIRYMSLYHCLSPAGMSLTFFYSVSSQMLQQFSV
jgi:hypothetical protein